MDAKKINLRLETSVEETLTKSDTIGLDNINARAKLLYGSEYGVAICSEYDAGSRVSLRIPILSKDANVGEDKHD